MALKKKGVPKDFTIDGAMIQHKKLYLPISEVIATLEFYRNLKGNAIAKLLRHYKINKTRRQK